VFNEDKSATADISWIDVNSSDMGRLYDMMRLQSFPNTVINRIVMSMFAGPVLLSMSDDGTPLDGRMGDMINRIFGSNMGRSFLWWKFTMGFVPIHAIVKEVEIVPSVPEYGLHRFQIRVNPRTRAPEMRAVYMGTKDFSGSARFTNDIVDPSVHIYMFGLESPNAITGQLRSRFMSIVPSYLSFKLAREQQQLTNARNCAPAYTTSMISTQTVASRFSVTGVGEEALKLAMLEHENALDDIVVAAHSEHSERLSKRLPSRGAWHENSGWLVPRVVPLDTIHRRSFPLPYGQQLQSLPQASFDGDVMALNRQFQLDVANLLQVPFEMFTEGTRSNNSASVAMEHFAQLIISVSNEYVDFIKTAFLKTYASRMVEARLRKCLAIIEASEVEDEIKPDDAAFIDGLYSDLLEGGEKAGTEAKGSKELPAAIKDTKEKSKTDAEVFTLVAVREIGADLVFIMPKVTNIERLLFLIKEGMMEWKNAVPLLATAMGLTETEFVREWVPEAERLASMAAENAVKLEKVKAKEATAGSSGAAVGGAKRKLASISRDEGEAGEGF